MHYTVNNHDIFRNIFSLFFFPSSSFLPPLETLGVAFSPFSHTKASLFGRTNKTHRVQNENTIMVQWIKNINKKNSARALQSARGLTTLCLSRAQCGSDRYHGDFWLRKQTRDFTYGEKTKSISKPINIALTQRHVNFVRALVRFRLFHRLWKLAVSHFCSGQARARYYLSNFLFCCGQKARYGLVFYRPVKPRVLAGCSSRIHASRHWKRTCWTKMWTRLWKCFALMWCELTSQRAWSPK